MAPVLKGTYVPATTLYYVRTGRLDPQVARKLIINALKQSKNGVAVAPLHIRFHWTAAIFRQQGNEIHATVLDSAPSYVTAKDIRRVLSMLKISSNHVKILCPGRQPRGSNECGVHTIVNAWRAFFDLNPFIADGTLSLHHLRHHFARLLSHSNLVESSARSIAANPCGELVPDTNIQGAGRRAQPSRTATEASTAALNLCYLYTATLALDTAKFGAHRQRSLDDLLCLQRALGHPPGVQNDVCEAIEHLSTTAPWYDVRVQRLATGDAIESSSTIILNPARVDVQLPRGVAELAHVRFYGKLEIINGEHVHARAGHYRFYWGAHRADQVAADGRAECTFVHVLSPPHPGSTGLTHHAGSTAAPLHHHYSSRVDQGEASPHTPSPPIGDTRHPPRQDLAPHPVPASQSAPAQAPTKEVTALPSPSQHTARNEVPAQVLAPQTPITHVGALKRALRTSEDKLHVILEEGRLARQRRDLQRQQPQQTSPPPADPPAPRKKATPQKKAAQQAPSASTIATSQPRPPSRKPTALSRTQIAHFNQTLRDGDSVHIHWASGKDAGKWYGKVVRTGKKVQVSFHTTLCDSCFAPRRITAFTACIPTAGMTYFQLNRRKAPITEPCACADVPDPELDEAEEPEEDVDATHQLDESDVHEVRGNIDRTVTASPDGEPLVEIVAGPPGVPKADVGKSWYVPHGKPPWVHELVWRQLAETTRLNHQRWLRMIKGMPADLRSRPMAQAIVEMILRMASARKWVWSTVASAFAACNAALANLPIYTTEAHGIKIAQDPYFQQAAKRAQHKARTTSSLESLSTGLTHEQYEFLTSSDGIKSHRVRLLLQMMWHWASRPKEMREVRPCDVVIKAPRDDSFSHVSITFHSGKVVPYCGPYTVHVMLPKEVTCALQAAVSQYPADQALFSTRDQAILAEVIGNLQGGDDGLPRLNLRSIRRGAVLHLAGKGVRDVELQLLTGHKRMDTLMRYLGWGRESATMREAAATRQQADNVRGAGVDEHNALPNAQQPPKMGPHSGYKGIKGRRVPSPPKFFPRKAPSAEECGIIKGDVDTSTYTLHIKETTRVDWPAVLKMAETTPLSAEAKAAQLWCNSHTFYGPRITTDPHKIPPATFTADQMEQLLRADKIRPHRGPINGFVNAFTIAQHNKKRLRVIAEPIINATCDRQQIYKVHYPSRLERRARARGARFEAELDFAAYFDQFELSPDVYSWFVLRAKSPVGGDSLFALTRLPMGVTFAPSVAQSVTSVLVMPLLAMEGIRVDTCIDNIRIVAEEPQQFATAMQVLLQRIELANVTLNDAQIWKVSEAELLQKCAVTTAPRVFLGERYIGDTISNSESNVEKLQQALERFEEGSGDTVYTMRNFASLIGLILFMAHTINVDLADYHTLLRAYGKIISDAAGWDYACTISSEAVIEQLRALAQRIIANPLIPLPVIEPPSRDLEDYDAAIEVDASGSAWGAIVRIRESQHVFTLQQRWTVSMLHSARAEPTAAMMAIQWVRRHIGREAKVAVITDHIAMAAGQRRWNSRYGGFSSSGYHLNEFYRELYRNGGGEVFYVEGELNRADGISRDPKAPFVLKVEEADLTFRDLGLVAHPFEQLERKQYQV